MVGPRIHQCQQRQPAVQTDYFLEVTIRIGLRSVGEFNALAGPVLRSVERDGNLRLMVAGRTASGTELFNVWKLSDPNFLRAGMIRLADNPLYGRLDRLVLDEQQDLTTPFGIIPKVRPALEPGGTFVRVCGRLLTRDLAEYQARHEAFSPSLLRARWRFWGATLSLTGRLNSVTSLWILPREKAISPVDLAQLPGADLFENVSVDQWSASDFLPAVNRH
jgi:hypothetical protein